MVTNNSYSRTDGDKSREISRLLTPQNMRAPCAHVPMSDSNAASTAAFRSSIPSLRSSHRHFSMKTMQSVCEKDEASDSELNQDESVKHLLLTTATSCSMLTKDLGSGEVSDSHCRRVRLRCCYKYVHGELSVIDGIFSSRWLLSVGEGQNETVNSVHYDSAQSETDSDSGCSWTAPF